MALDKPFGALNNGYYGPTMVLKTIIIFPQRYPQRSGVESDPDHYASPRTSDQIHDLSVGFVGWSGGRDFDWAAPSVSTILPEGLP